MQTSAGCADLSRIALEVFSAHIRVARLVHPVEAVVEPGMSARTDKTVAYSVLAILIDKMCEIAPRHGPAQVRVGQAGSGASRHFFVEGEQPLQSMPYARPACLDDKLDGLRVAYDSWPGLASVADLLDAQAGNLWIESARGGGLRVCFVLPAVL